MTNTVLVTGGAGYIGSHTVRQLVDAGYPVVVLDNFYSGHRWAVPDAATLVEGDVSDRALVEQVLREHDVQSVVHFAAHIVVPESVADPLKYYRNNTVASCQLLSACASVGVQQFIFSSTAAVYGTPEQIPVDESAPTLPMSPYGSSKLATEWMLRDLLSSQQAVDAPTGSGFRYVALRYFNVAGASLDGRLGQATPEATHLIKVSCEAACGKRDRVMVFGTDYPTPDGTGIRDYIHVEDLASAHVAALRHLEQGRPSQILNCGYGRGFSVREVIAMVKKVSGIDFAVADAPRRAGDVSALVADVTRIGQVLDWAPQYDDLELICRTAYEWEKKDQP